MTSIQPYLERGIIQEEKLTEFKLVAIDMDGTALNRDHLLSKRTIESIRNVESKGLKILLATGRMTAAVTEHLKDLGTSGLVVAHNGALVKDLHKNKVYMHKKVPSRVVERVIKLHEAYNFILHLNIDDDVFVNNINSISNRFSKELGIKLKYSESYSEIKEEPTSILLLQGKDKLEEILEDIKIHNPNMFDYVLIPWTKGLWMLQILPINTSKGMAVFDVAKQLGIKLDEIISFGDSYNDLEMIQHSGLGIAMENACDELKEVATYITKSNAEDGVAQVLEELLKNE